MFRSDVAEGAFNSTADIAIVSLAEEGCRRETVDWRDSWKVRGQTPRFPAVRIRNCVDAAADQFASNARNRATMALAVPDLTRSADIRINQ